MSLQRILKQIRLFNRITQAELSAKIVVSRCYISEIENGKKTPSLEILNKYSEAFDLPVSVILLFAENGDKTSVKHKLTKAVLSFLEWISKVK